MSLSPEPLIRFLHGVPPELLLLVQAGLCFGAVLLLARLFGAAGLYLYIVVAIVGANIEVLKPVSLAFYAHPVAMGTVLFSSTYLATDILAEHYGRDAARKAVFLGFAGYLLFVLFTLVTLGFRPLTAAEAGADMGWAVPMHDHMAALFTPAPALLVAGMTAYLTSQLLDVWLYQRIRRATSGRYLWLRNNGSTLVSGLVDNIVFSVLAWVVLAPQPVGWEALVFTYILGTYGLRVAVALLDTPFMYLSRAALKGQADLPPAGRG